MSGTGGKAGESHVDTEKSLPEAARRNMGGILLETKVRVGKELNINSKREMRVRKRGRKSKVSG